jgi:hypothetical protein
MQQDEDLKCLDDLIVNLGGADHGKRSNGSCGLPLEHLQAARRGLLGCMRAEYRSSLEQAKESVGCVPDKNNRSEIKKTLRRLIDSRESAPPRPWKPAGRASCLTRFRSLRRTEHIPGIRSGTPQPSLPSRVIR